MVKAPRQQRSKKSQEFLEDKPNQEAEITAVNLDPSVLYSIDADGQRAYGYPVRLAHDPTQTEVLADNTVGNVRFDNPQRFFVCSPISSQLPYTMPIEEAVASDIKREGRVSESELASWQQWLSRHALA